MSTPRPATARALAYGAILVVIGLAAWAMYVKQSDGGPHAYSRDGVPPAFVQVVAGHTYSIAIHDGVRREAELGLDPAALRCTAARPGAAPQALELTTQPSDTKATNDIATFVARSSGAAHVECESVGAVFVDDAADAPFDWSGLWLVLASLALLVGLPLTLSGVRGAAVSPGSAGTHRHYDEVE